MRIYKSVWHTDLWAANNCRQEDINNFFEVFNELSKELLELESEIDIDVGIMTKSKFLVRTQVDGSPLLRLIYLGLSEVFTPCSRREEVYSKILTAMPLVSTPQGIDYIFFPDHTGQ